MENSVEMCRALADGVVITNECKCDFYMWKSDCRKTLDVTINGEKENRLVFLRCCNKPIESCFFI